MLAGYLPLAHAHNLHQHQHHSHQQQREQAAAHYRMASTPSVLGGHGGLGPFIGGGPAAAPAGGMAFARHHAPALPPAFHHPHHPTTHQQAHNHQQHHLHSHTSNPYAVMASDEELAQLQKLSSEYEPEPTVCTLPRLLTIRHPTLAAS